MILWGIDTSTKFTGWAAGAPDARPETGAWSHEHVGRDVGLLLELLRADMNALADRLPPDVIIFESPILTRFDTPMKLRKLYSMPGYIELWARDLAKARGAPVIVQEENLKVLKKLLTGSSKAEKPEMVAMARKMGITLPKGEGAKDAADAFAAWLCCVHNHAREHQPYWDRLLYSPRGGLL